MNSAHVPLRVRWLVEGRPAQHRRRAAAHLPSVRCGIRTRTGSISTTAPGLATTLRPSVDQQRSKRCAVCVSASTALPSSYDDPRSSLAPAWSNGGDLQPSGEWRRNLNLKAWAEEVREVERELRATGQSQEDVAHLHTILNTTNAFWWLGLGLCPFYAIPSAVLMSTAIVARWTMVGHHVCHGGYNTAQSEGGVITGQFHRRSFALGLRKRMVDWLDWMKPEAWDVEHNNLHHYKLGEDGPEGDPDLVERNLLPVRSMKAAGAPLWRRLLQVAPLMLIWKWYYYVPNTLNHLERWETSKAAKRGKPLPPQNWAEGGLGQDLDWWKCCLPFGLFMFVAIPGATYFLLGTAAAQTAMASVVLAEMLTNFHSFAIIATNHAGEDIYKFETPVQAKSDEFYLRAVIGSANFHTGSDFGEPGSLPANVVDFPQGWLNYQIEHHMWPDLSMLSYQKAAPRVRAICEKYGVPYVQEPVWTRLRKTLDVMTGEADMRSWEAGQ